MAADRKVPLEQGRLRLPSETAAQLATAGTAALELVHGSPRLLTLTTGNHVLHPSKESFFALAGDLSRIPPPDLFSFITMTQKSGMLKFLTPAGVKTVYFERGEILFANSTAEEDRLGNFLYRRGILDKRQLKEAEKNCPPGTRFGKVLVELGYLDPKKLWAAVREQVEELVYALFTLREGEFIFVEGTNLLDEDLAGFSLSSQNLLMEGIRRSDEMVVIREYIPSDDIVPTKKTPPAGKQPPEEAAWVLDLVDGAKSVRQIGRASRRSDFDVKRALYELAKAGWIEARASGPAPVQDAGARIEGTIRSYNKLFAQIHNALKSVSKTLDVDKTLASFFDDISKSRFAQLFEGVRLSPAGELDGGKLLANLDHITKSRSGTALAIAGLSELLTFELLTDGLNEFLNFEIFTVRNSCPDAQAAEIIKKIRQVQATLATKGNA